MSKLKVTFHPQNKTVEADKGETLLACAISAGIYLNSACGGDGICGKCKVIVKKGIVHAPSTSKLSSEEKKKGYVLACLSTVESDTEIEIPAHTELNLDNVKLYAKIEDGEVKELPGKDDIFKHSPLSTKLFLELPKPTITDNISDLERLYRQIRKVKDISIMQTGIANIRSLNKILRSDDWKITVTLGNRNKTTEIVLIEAGNTSEKNYGIAFDIGTTTLSAQLINLNTKKILGTKITYNRQAVFGADVITRIIYAQKEEGLEVLHRAVTNEMNVVIEEFTKEYKINRSDINCCLCAGNTTMIHLLLRLDPTHIRRDPYIPVANSIPVIRAKEAGIEINQRALLACVPGVSSYVGGDITAGVLSSGMDTTNKLTLLIDIGTNGEIVLGNKDWLVCTAASAGPAFEGSGVACGMRAVAGAIQRVDIKNNHLEIIGGGDPRGICGSGYIDLIAELLKEKIIDKNGKFIHDAKIRVKEGEKEFVLSSGKDSDIVITEADIDNIKRSKAAIFSAASVLVRHMESSFDKIDQILIAGGFGTYLDIEKSISIGLLPDVDRKKIKFIGNSSLSGARQILLSSEALERSEEIAKKMTYFELSRDYYYMDEYCAGLFFPHTDLNKFPSVKT